MTTKKRMTEAQFRAQWMRAQEEIADLIYRGNRLQSLLPTLYEGVLGEEPPEHEYRVQWDEDRKKEAG